METKELKIITPEGYEIDRENSTLECIKFKLKIKEESTDTQDTVHCLKPFDKVLVSRYNSIWFPAFFWEICDGYYRTTDGKIYERCIPYEGNEDLLGTSSIWFKPDKAHKC